MHYYKRHIGDYAKKCGRLTMLQHGAYTLLMDSIYDKEKFPTIDQAIEWSWASTEAEVEAVKFVLSRFFKLTESGEYVQQRISEELENYHKNSETNKRIAIERETKRRENSTNREPTVDEPPPNHKPLTTNQEPLTNNHKKKTTVVEAPFGVSSEVWDSFVQQRKASRAVITETVVKQIEAEASKVGWSLEQALSEVVARGWRGFKAAWVVDKPGDRRANALSALTGGVASPKPFFARPETKSIVEVENVEPKRIT